MWMLRRTFVAILSVWIAQGTLLCGAAPADAAAPPVSCHAIVHTVGLARGSPVLDSASHHDTGTLDCCQDHRIGRQPKRSDYRFPLTTVAVIPIADRAAPPAGPSRAVLFVPGIPPDTLALQDTIRLRI